jgi:hypothetical protein
MEVSLREAVFDGFRRAGSDICFLGDASARVRGSFLSFPSLKILRVLCAFVV